MTLASGAGCGARAWRLVRCHSRAALGIMLAGIKTGAWGAATGLGQETPGNARGNHVPGSLA